MGRPILKTKLCDMLGIEYPILSAGMGPSLIGEKPGAPVELVVAVSEAGGMGVLGGAGHTIDELRDDIREIKKQTDKPFGIDLLLPKAQVDNGDMGGDGGEMPLMDIVNTLPAPYVEWFRGVQKKYDLPDPDAVVKADSTTTNPHASVKVCIEEKVPLFCAGLGDPGFMVEEAHASGMKVLAITGNTKNGARMAKSGIDLLVAQGHEAGGHTGRIGTMALLPQVMDAAAPVPVLAAGGIGDGRGVAAVLAMGCIGAWIGTRFLATEEGGLVPAQEEFIINATDEDTRRAHWHTGKTTRTIKSQVHDLWESSGLEPLAFPLQALLSSALIGSFHQAEKSEFLGPYAGQISGLINEIKPARVVLEELVAETAEILSRTLPQSVTASV